MYYTIYVYIYIYKYPKLLRVYIIYDSACVCVCATKKHKKDLYQTVSSLSPTKHCIEAVLMRSCLSRIWREIGRLSRKDVLQGSRRKVYMQNIAKSISKSRKTKSQKVERFRFEFRKVEKYTFYYFLNFCQMRFQPNMRSSFFQLKKVAN